MGRRGRVAPDDVALPGAGTATEERAATGIDFEGRDHFVPRLHGSPAFRQERARGNASSGMSNLRLLEAAFQ